VRIDEAKTVLIDAFGADHAKQSRHCREAIEALPDRTLFDQLDPLLRALIETRLHQLVTLEVVS
jgi:hypothetical protein